MPIIEEYIGYRTFISVNFPNSIFTKNIMDPKKTTEKQILTSIFKSIQLVTMYSDHEDVSIIMKSLLLDLKMSIIRLLYILPLNDKFFYSSILRQISELCLKIKYSEINPDYNYEQISTISYRFLWDECIKLNIKDLPSQKDTLNHINQIYKERSDVIHDKKRKFDNSINYLSILLCTSQEQDVKILNKNTSLFLKFCDSILLEILNISPHELSHHQKSIIKSIKLKDSQFTSL